MFESLTTRLGEVFDRLTRRGALSRLVYGATAARVSRVAAQQVLAVPQSLAA